MSLLLNIFLVSLSLAGLADAAWGEDAAQKALQQNQLQRQHQQDRLLLRMQQQQQQRNVQSPSADARQEQERERIEINQRQRQQALQYRQQIEPPSAQPSDDEGTRHAKAQIERQHAQRQSQQQLQRFDQERQQAAEHGPAPK